MFCPYFNRIFVLIKHCFDEYLTQLYYFNQIKLKRRLLLMKNIKLHQFTWHLTIYFYACFMATRFAVSSYGLRHFSIEKFTYFKYDIVTKLIHLKSKGDFDATSFALCACLFVYCIVEHFIRNYATDFAIFDQQYRLVAGNLKDFTEKFPKFSIKFSSTRIAKNLILLPLNVVKIKLNLKNFKSFTNQAKVVQLIYFIEIINFAIYFWLSK